MEEYRKIVNFIKKSNTIISSKDFKANNISYYYINKLIKDNYIKKISKGIYGKMDSFDDDYSIIQQKFAPLSMYGISSKEPFVEWGFLRIYTEK